LFALEILEKERKGKIALEDLQKIAKRGLGM
jgi:hypothetical protein